MHKSKYSVCTKSVLILRSAQEGITHIRSNKNTLRSTTVSCWRATGSEGCCGQTLRLRKLIAIKTLQLDVQQSRLFDMDQASRWGRGGLKEQFGIS